VLVNIVVVKLKAILLQYIYLEISLLLDTVFVINAFLGFKSCPSSRDIVDL